MNIVPAIDLLGGHVVHGVAGQRSNYSPIASVLASGSDPRVIAAALRKFGFRRAYIADLDAIAGGDFDPEILDVAFERGLRLWIDAGQRNAVTPAWADHPAIDRLVTGLETLESPEALDALVDRMGPERLLFSLDMNEGRALTASERWPESTEEIVERVRTAGVRHVLLLDLARVGLGRGTGTEALTGSIRMERPDLTVSVGGGIQTLEELIRFETLGVEAVLVASALHDGSLSRADLGRWLATDDPVDKTLALGGVEAITHRKPGPG
ncbi:1-(5-phosphoribosyl)-5-[(5-phosphoribosylamino)methylideneamino] imidazole-4-carboxamide isomerase [Planctomycetes bacterium Pan216]|uniref:1-(5-phosphoribosyl)-5-[(5-phosphoribosylamino)methylideneamino] imidazole-4-carboxamide isomerase n=1 Tax=Kolteria novifilia TaxID=2527975 RepID=A0A518AWT9_9BACT|nr:1-(5-phosphoribosyl)-5-[(5-phosphoribosylamino)methylideneamino] imidazole-4-carboxamide isomerase [Planctomycetes bacterium Pan216]